MSDEKGYTKFKCIPVESHNPLTRNFPGFKQVNTWRDKLYSFGLIGVYPSGIGFGNLSVRAGDTNRFYITGSGTGEIKRLSVKHYPKVLEYSIQENWVKFRGKISASSESLTHAAVYEHSPDTRTVFHIHSREMWQRLMDQIPTTSKQVEYGTPAMAEEMGRLFRKTDLAQRKILVMGGHEEGIITFGHTPDEAGSILLAHLQTPASISQYL